LWKAYTADERQGIILAKALKKTCAGLFEMAFCPYLEGDEIILDFLKSEVKASSKDMIFMLETYRSLN
jgi:hypothetical protein